MNNNEGEKMKIYENYNEIETILKNTEFSLEDYQSIMNHMGDEKSKITSCYIKKG